MVRKYYDGNWDARRKVLTEDVYKEKINQPSGPTGTIKKRYLEYKDAQGEILLRMVEYTRADDSHAIIVTILVEGDTVYHTEP